MREFDYFIKSTCREGCCGVSRYDVVVNRKAGRAKRALLSCLCSVLEGETTSLFRTFESCGIIRNMKREFTAVYKKQGKWYLGWVEEISGVNTQGKTLEETKENLQEALTLVLEANRMLSNKAAGKTATRETLRVSI